MDVEWAKDGETGELFKHVWRGVARR